MNAAPVLLAEIDRLSDVLVEVLAQLDDAVTGSQVTGHACALARRARDTGERLVAAVKQLGDAVALDRAEQMAACAIALDRQINGGTLQ